MRAFRNRRTVSLRCLTLALLVASVSVAPTAAAAQDAEGWDVQELVEKLNASERPYLPFLDRDTLSTGIYRLAAGAKDGQSPHTMDEVYYVVEGKAKLVAGGETLNVEPGGILFVGAHVDHEFVDIEEDLVLVVFFSKAPVESPDP